MKLLDEVKDFVDPYLYRFEYHDNEMNANNWSMNSAYYRLKSFGNMFSPLPYNQFPYMLNQYLTQYRKVSGAGYHVYNSNSKPLNLDYELLYRNEDFDVYLDDTAFPRLYVSNQTKLFQGNANQFNKYLKDITLNNEISYLSLDNLLELAENTEINNTVPPVSYTHLTLPTNREV